MRSAKIRNGITYRAIFARSKSRPDELRHVKEVETVKKEPAGANKPKEHTLKFKAVTAGIRF